MPAEALVQFALRPEGSRIATVTPEFEFGPAAFGYATIPTPIPAHYQGQRITFEVGATVWYPEGRGKMVRFRCGIAVPHNVRFRSLSVAIERLLLLFTGHLLLSRFALTTLTLPTNVAEQLPDGVTPHVETLWTISPV